MALTRVLDWIKENWKFVSTLLVIVASFWGLKLTFRAGDPNSKPEVIIVIPTADGTEVQDLRPAETGDYLAAQVVLKIAIAILEHRAIRTESDWDDRLLVLLKLLVSDRGAFERVELAARGR